MMLLLALGAMMPFDQRRKSKKRQPRVYVYTIVTDSGYAPNADGPYLTLATCKPDIRERAQVGDIIIAHHKKARGGGMCYAMVVTEKMWQNEYYNDERFKYKIPSAANPTGDNCYRPLANGSYEQLPCQHSSCSQDVIERDLRAPVLISDCFTYFGRNSVKSAEPANQLPMWLRKWHHPAYTNTNEDETLFDYERTMEWMATLPKGKLNEPTDKPKGRCGGRRQGGGC